MIFNGSPLNAAAFNASSSRGYGDKPRMPDGVAITGEVYILVLTGNQNGLDDVILPTVNINLRWSSGGYAWISMVVPNGSHYVDDITSRPNGEMVLLYGEKWSDGKTVISELLRAPVSVARLDEGSFSQSYTLQGYTDMLSPSVIGVKINDSSLVFWGGLAQNRLAETKLIDGITYKRGSNRGREVRAKIDTSIRIGDTVSYLGGNSFVVRVLQWNISNSRREVLCSE